MANIAQSGMTQTTITVYIDNLPYYDYYIEMYRFRANNGQWYEFAPYREFVYYSLSVMYSGFSCGSSIFIEGQYKYQSVWYTANPRWCYTDSCPPPPKPTLSIPSYISHSSTGNSITITISSVNGSEEYGYQLRHPDGTLHDITTTSTTTTFTLLSPFTTYQVRWRAIDTNGSHYSSSYSSYMDISTTNTRPNNWEWETSKVSGNYFNLTAGEWNLFTIRINDFREYKGLQNMLFDTAMQGAPFTASMFNQAHDAINAMNPQVPLPSIVTTGGIIYANSINWLRDSLNSIQ